MESDMLKPNTHNYETKIPNKQRPNLFSPKTQENMEYLFIAIAPRSTLNQVGVAPNKVLSIGQIELCHI